MQVSGSFSEAFGRGGVGLLDYVRGLSCLSCFGGLDILTRAVQRYKADEANVAARGYSDAEAAFSGHVRG